MGSMFRKYYILILALSFFGLAAACGGEGTTERITPSLDAPTPDRPAPPVAPLEKPATTADGITTEDAEFVEGEDLPEAGQDGLAKVTLSPFSRTREGEAVITLRVEPESPPADNSASEGKFLVATDHKTIERVLFDVTLLDRECYHQRTGDVDERGIGTTEQICKEQSSYNGYFNARYLEKRGVRVSFGEAFNRWYRRNAPGGAGIDEDNLISFEVQLQFEDGTYSNRVYSPGIVLEDLEEFISEPLAVLGSFFPFRQFGGTSNVGISFLTSWEDTSSVFVEEDLTLNYSVAIYPDGAREPEDFEYKTFDVLSGDARVEIPDDVPRYKSYMVWSLLDGEGYKPADWLSDDVSKVEWARTWNIDISRNGICDYDCVLIQVVEEESDIPGYNGNGDNGVERLPLTSGEFSQGDTVVHVESRLPADTGLEVFLPSELESGGETIEELTVTLMPSDAEIDAGRFGYTGDDSDHGLVDVDVSPVPDAAVRICLPVTEGLRRAAGEQRLYLIRFSGGTWEELSSTAEGETVCANVNGFSPFAVVYEL